MLTTSKDNTSTRSITRASTLSFFRFSEMAGGRCHEDKEINSEIVQRRDIKASAELGPHNLASNGGCRSDQVGEKAKIDRPSAGSPVFKFY